MPAMHATNKELMRSSRLSDLDRQIMLDRLDAMEAGNRNKNRRQGARVPFRRNEVAVRVQHPGGSTSAAMVSTRNISAGGLSFLWEGFLHKGTKVEVVLHRRLGGEDVVHGVVTHCALVVKSIHLVGMRFETKVFPKVYLDPSEWGELSEASEVRTEELGGVVLHLDDQEMDRLLVKHFLKGTRIELVSVARIDEGIKALKDRPVDCVLCDLTLEAESGLEAIKRFRAAGYCGPLAVVTAETSPQQLKLAETAGANAILSKPFDGNKLVGVLATWMSASTSSGEPILSTLSSDSNMLPIVEQYVQRLRMLAGDIRKGIDNQNLSSLRNVCQIIKGTASGFGFASISSYARDAVACMDCSTDLKDSVTQILILQSACSRASAKAA